MADDEDEGLEGCILVAPGLSRDKALDDPTRFTVQRSSLIHGNPCQSPPIVVVLGWSVPNEGLRMDRSGIEPRMFSGPLGRTGLVFPRSPPARCPQSNLDNQPGKGDGQGKDVFAKWQTDRTVCVPAAITTVNTLVLRSQTEAMDAATLDCRSLEPPPVACPWKAGKGCYSTATMHAGLWPWVEGWAQWVPWTLALGLEQAVPTFKAPPLRHECGRLGSPEFFFPVLYCCGILTVFCTYQLHHLGFSFLPFADSHSLLFEIQSVVVAVLRSCFCRCFCSLCSLVLPIRVLSLLLMCRTFGL